MYPVNIETERAIDMTGLKKWSCIMGAAILVAVTGVIGTGTQSQAKRLMDKPKVLKEGKTYRYDIDGDSKKEKIKIEEEGDSDKYKVKTTIYVNDKKYAVVSESGSFSHEVFLCDLYAKKKGMNLVVLGTSDSDCLGKFRVYHMAAKKMTLIGQMKGGTKKNLKINRLAMKLSQAKDEGNFYIYPDTPIYLNNFGCYYTRVQCKIENKKVKIVPQQSYAYKYDYTFKLARNTFMYASADKNSEQITLKAGTKLNVLRIQLVSRDSDERATSFVQIKTKSGKTGWFYDVPIDDYDSYIPLFKDMPQWG